MVNHKTVKASEKSGVFFIYAFLIILRIKITNLRYRCLHIGAIRVSVQNSPSLLHLKKLQGKLLQNIKNPP